MVEALIGGGIAAAVAGLVAWRVWSGRTRWTDLGVYGMRYRGPADRAVLAAQVRRAVDAIAHYSPWSRVDIERAVTGVSIVVYPTPTVHDLFGREGDGFLTGDTVHVGCTLAALAHELIHRCRILFDGQLDLDREHAAWGPLGLRSAEAAFEASL